MRRAIRAVMYASGLAALATAALALDAAWIHPEGPIEFLSESCRFPTPLLVGLESELTVKIHNGQHRSVRLIGGEEACGPSGCAAVRGMPLTIPPGEDREVTVAFKPAVSGPIGYEGPVYTDCPAHPTISLRLEGMAIETQDP